MVRGYTLQYSNSWWPSDTESRSTKAFIKRMTHAGDTYVDINAFIELVNKCIDDRFDYEYENYYDDEDYCYNCEKKKYRKEYAVTEEMLNEIEVGDYYCLFGEQPEENWVIRCHNVI